MAGRQREVRPLPTAVLDTADEGGELPSGQLEPLELDFDPESCQELSLPVDMTRSGEYESTHGVRVEVLQRPEFTEELRSDPETRRPVPPVEWDRAEMPQGACVARIRGIDAECYSNQRSMAIFYPEADSGGPIGQASYHARRWAGDFDLCEWPVPGCPGPKWGSFAGYWWYLTQREGDVLLVSCATSCQAFFGQEITLELRTEDGPGLCADYDAGAAP